LAHAESVSVHAASSCPVLRAGRFTWTLNRPHIMGVLNLTPDSFSDGGRWLDPGAALHQAERLMAEGADLIDLGAESTRPGAPSVAVETELARLVPVLKPLVTAGVPVSVDTRKPEVMRVVLDLGADMINDVAGFASPEARAVVSAGSAALCVMHMAGDPLTMQAAPSYGDVVSEVRAFLADRVTALCQAGVARARILIDPGIGFGKTVDHNLALLNQVQDIRALGYPVLVGVSRKSMVGALTGRPVAERLPGSLAAMLAAVARGVHWVRVHDVAATRDALVVWRAIDAARDRGAKPVVASHE
jgi:dihydropteroate synthase